MLPLTFYLRRRLSLVSVCLSQCWHGGIGNTTGGKFLNNHNWLEFWDDVAGQWVVSAAQRSCRPSPPLLLLRSLVFAYSCLPACRTNERLSSPDRQRPGRQHQKHVRRHGRLGARLRLEQRDGLQGGLRRRALRRDARPRDRGCALALGMGDTVICSPP
eukprot:SAG22_NODE_1843_length_3455_cov_2.608760_7_plen_158_part_01